jgi:hypothetical protein
VGKGDNLNGNDDANSPPFTLQGGEQRAMAHLVGYRPGVDPDVVGTTFYLEPLSGGDETKIIDANGAGDYTGYAYATSGSYYLQPNSANAV